MVEKIGLILVYKLKRTKPWKDHARHDQGPKAETGQNQKDLGTSSGTRKLRAAPPLASGVFTIMDKYKCRDTEKINFMLPMLEKS